MTLIAGIRCLDGVVIGSDSAGTFSSVRGVTTIAQHLSRKIDVVDNHVIVAGTGEVGLGQRFVAIVEEQWRSKKFQGKSAIDIGKILSVEAKHDFSITNAQPGTYGALVAVPRDGHTAELIELDINCFQPEVKDKNNIWYVSMGAGQSVADPLLGFMREAFWGDDPPSLEDGVFAMTMMLTLGCKMAPFGVAAPIQMALLRPEKKGLRASRLSNGEIAEHLGNVEEVIGYFGKYRDVLSGADTSTQQPWPEAPKPK